MIREWKRKGQERGSMEGNKDIHRSELARASLVIPGCLGPRLPRGVVSRWCTCLCHICLEYQPAASLSSLSFLFPF